MNELTIHTPELAEALNNLAEALRSRRTPNIKTPAAAEVETVVAAAKPITQTPTQPVPPTAAPVAPVAPIAPAAPAIPVTAPVAPPQQYTLDQVSQAAVQWAGNDRGRMGQLQEIVRQFGVASLTQLPTDQLGAFATAARGLGVQV